LLIRRGRQVDGAADVGAGLGRTEVTDGAGNGDAGELPADGDRPDGAAPVDVGPGGAAVVAGAVVAGTPVGSGDRVVRVGLVPPVLPGSGGGRTSK
jgi:hypothetical protein